MLACCRVISKGESAWPWRSRLTGCPGIAAPSDRHARARYRSRRRGGVKIGAGQSPDECPVLSAERAGERTQLPGNWALRIIVILQQLETALPTRRTR